MIRRRLAVALVAATSTALALVTPAQAEDTSSLSSTGTTEATGDLPGAAGSAVLDEDTKLVLDVIGAVMKIGMVATQGSVILLPLIPGGVDQLRNFLAQFGIRA